MVGMQYYKLPYSEKNYSLSKNILNKEDIDCYCYSCLKLTHKDLKNKRDSYMRLTPEHYKIFKDRGFHLYKSSVNDFKAYILDKSFDLLKKDIDVISILQEVNYNLTGRK